MYSISQTDAVRIPRVYDEERGVMSPIFKIEFVAMHINLWYASADADERFSAATSTIEDEDTNVIKMIVAIGLLLGGQEHCDLAQTIFQYMEPIIGGTMHWFHSDEDGQAWRLVGVAARLCYEMGLLRKDSLIKSFKNSDDYLNAVRLFWIIYSLDRSRSFGPGLPFALQDADIDHLIPEPDIKNLYLKHSTRFSGMYSMLWSLNLSYESDKKGRLDEIGFLDLQIQQ